MEKEEVEFDEKKRKKKLNNYIVERHIRDCVRHEKPTDTRHTWSSCNEREKHQKYTTKRCSFTYNNS